jgi:glyoxylase-like metal-dependent hydrolase (beta-lactamase superfamily II)
LIEQILPGLWQIEVPLPKNPLQSINSYVLKEDGRFLVIDTGMNIEACAKALTGGLRELDVDLRKTDFFITHLHYDHMGLVSALATEGSKVYFNRPEMLIMQQLLGNTRWTTLLNFNEANGFPREEMMKGMPNMSSSLYTAKRPVTFTPLAEGDVLEIGNYRLACIETPGHSPGHICLYEKDKKLLFSGDHILFDITPNITWYPEMPDSLARYLKSLDKVYPLDVEFVLPGHRSRMNNHRARIREIQAHHEDRLNEADAALKNGSKTAYDVAANISWDITCDGWHDFPVAQKYFAVGETIAHLEYLAGAGRVRKTAVDGKILYHAV